MALKTILKDVYLSVNLTLLTLFRGLRFVAFRRNHFRACWLPTNSLDSAHNSKEQSHLVHPCDTHTHLMLPKS